MTDTSYEKALAQKLAEELITSIKVKVAPRAAILEDRIEKARSYLNSITNPTPPAIDHVRRFLDGEYDDLPFDAPAALLRNLFEKRFICRVVSSGYNNGAGCTPDDPHGPEWRCGYFWTTGALTDQQAREYGLITETTETTP